MSEFDLFLEELGGVKPLKSSPTYTATQKKNTLTEEQAQQRRENAERSAAFDPNPLATENVQLVDPDELLSYKKSGVQDGVFKNLRLGKYEIHTVLNIQGQSIKQARQNLYQFIQDSHKSDMRSLLIQHGKGLHSKPHPGLLKSYVNQWLRQLDEVKAFHSAQPFHGGSGSVYVLLKKSEEARLTNKERHQKRGANG
ncbi:DNA endonuclease SmrA [Psychrosphaera ytuae]|uniref:DNA endonuclease SmrA n=1 Tax=Psychrosphaera ytuae TaxID=2820710 RepID=A0A975DAX8_9GAMM|nr:DNA endonuclease SmrA [Psychrosphaera ytuae]QTH63830.1 DNA endonuclease SmrA [Psychrosphaera ytuae]